MSVIVELSLPRFYSLRYVIQAATAAAVSVAASVAAACRAAAAGAGGAAARRRARRAGRRVGLAWRDSDGHGGREVLHAVVVGRGDAAGAPAAAPESGCHQAGQPSAARAPNTIETLTAHS